MKCYFDNLDEHQANMHSLSTGTGGDWWLIPNGSIIKKQLRSAGATVTTLDSLDEPGCYFIDVNGDPNWWSGQGFGVNTPEKHVLLEVPANIINLVKQKKLRLVISADREGGLMKNQYIDAFEVTTDAIKELGIPAGSVLIIQGNKKIEQQYATWLEETQKPKLFDVMYSNHFGRIFFDQQLPEIPIVEESIKNSEVVSFNSLNRVYRTHRGTHLYTLAESNLLKYGLVSGNEIKYFDEPAIRFLRTTQEKFNDVMKAHYPKFIDGNWAQENAANQYNLDIYKNSLLSFITETKFDEDVVFLTEKVFKPIALGHPMIVLSSAGTLRGLEELGFKVNWCGIDPKYNDIKDDKNRFAATHNELVNWIMLPLEEKIARIKDSMGILNFNLNLIKEKDFHKEALQEALRRSKEYFNA